MTRKFFNGISRKASPLVLFVAILSIAIAPADASPNCNALVSANNQLYLVSKEGALLSQFLTDSLPKRSVTLSPDGTKIAYIASSNPNAFTVVDSSGRSATMAVKAPSQAIFYEVAWDANAVLQARSHISPTTGVSQFYSVPASFSSPFAKIGALTTPDVCAAKPSADGNNIACVSENTLAVGKKVLASTEALSKSRSASLGTLKVPVRSSISTQTSPAFRVTVVEVDDGVSLRITFPNESWTQTRVSIGEAIPVRLDDDEYGFTPISVDSAKGVVTVQVTKRNGAVGYDSAISWGGNNYVTAVERTANGAQLVLAKSDGNEVPTRFDIPNSEPVSSLTYTTPTLLVLRFQSHFGALPISIINGAPTIGAMTILPTRLAVALPSGKMNVTVEGWSCH